MNNIPITLYIHIPWCLKKCPYCDFNSYTSSVSNIPEEAYIDALLKDLQNDAVRWLQGRAISAIYIGGGTPSLISSKTWENFFQVLQQKISFSSDMEITLEANPATFDLNKAVAWRSLGINRISLGVQSFQDQKLQSLGRIHDAAQALMAVDYLQKAGFFNFNIDLMYGLPQQNLSDAIFDLKTALNLGATHLSWYQLTIEPNTVFGRQKPVLPNEDLLWQMQEEGVAVIADSGMQQYEISAYSKSHYRCQHNYNYWQFGDYLGIGAGAHGKITDTVSSEIIRYSKLANPQSYILNENRFPGLAQIDSSSLDFPLDGNERGSQQRGKPKCEEYISSPDNRNATCQVVSQNELPLEFMLNALRLHEPIPIDLFTERTFLDLTKINKILKSAQEKKLLEYNSSHFITTALGRRFLDDLLLLFAI